MPAALKLKTFIIRTMVRGLPREHIPANGDTMKSVVIQAPSMKRAAEILGTTTASLRTWGCTRDDSRAHLAPKPETVYYEPGNFGGPAVRGYIELVLDKPVVA